VVFFFFVFFFFFFFFFNRNAMPGFETEFSGVISCDYPFSLPVTP
jgi:hypothetical protein